ncbi:bile acid:sodium symporter family protein [Euzebya tangerina]|uniref:bile acid:sodium symporter family protein n=1 Tax=Euzebya tangerina TaxID=591198 RepID=UPI000E30E65A|nr:bile acid:sodium symporter family protein [Euzebya tangerina]
MESGVLSEVILPLCIVVIMIAMGMTLTVADFRRVMSAPKQIAIGLVCQMLLLPALGFAVAAVFPLDAVFAVSIVLLAAAPGGTTSNLIVHAAEGDRALSVSLTALSNSIVWLTMPFLLGLAFRTFDDGSQPIAFPVGEVMVQVAALTIVPVLIGMAVRARRPSLAERLKEPSKIFAAAFLFLVIVALVIQNIDQVMEEGPRFAPAFIALNAIALVVGFGVARIAGLDQKQSSTIAIETGLQNSTLAITIALSVLDSAEIAIIPGLYGVWMLVTGFAFAFLTNRDRSEAGVRVA